MTKYSIEDKLITNEQINQIDISLLKDTIKDDNLDSKNEKLV